jgi:hypothetical protein
MCPRTGCAALRLDQTGVRVMLGIAWIYSLPYSYVELASGVLRAVA